MKVIGVDLSLTRTGLAGDHWHTTVRSAPAKNVEYGAPPRSFTARGRRIHALATELATYTLSADLVVVEGPSYGHNAEAGAFDRAGLWWQVILTLQAADVRYAVASPAAVKQYATGKGNASKDDVMRAVCRRFDWFDGDNNEADAVTLMAIGYDRLGTPVVDMPARHREALIKVDWPDPANHK